MRGGTRRSVVAAVLLGLAGALAPGAGAVPPVPVEVLPCVSPSMGARTVLLSGPAAVPVPTDATELGGVVRLGVRALRLPSAARAHAVVAQLRATPGVRWAEVDLPVSAMRTPNDPLAARQWALQKIGAPRAWDIETGRRNPVIAAVLDTGVDGTHPDLAGRVRPGGDFIAGDADPMDEHFHGTSVAGALAASTHNGKGVAGVSWGATVLAERVLDANGSGSMCTVAAGVIDAVDAGARVLNLSLGGPAPECPLIVEEALKYAKDHGALVVVSAGNDGARGNPVNYPAGCDGAFAVGATDSRDVVARFSEHGPQVDISAPGVKILTTYRTDKGVPGYAYLNGTSVAAPIVSGAAALLFSLHPTWTPEQVEARLVATAKDLGKRGRDDYYGAGRVDVARAVR